MNGINEMWVQVHYFTSSPSSPGFHSNPGSGWRDFARAKFESL